MSIFHRNKKKVDKSIKKMDAIITGLVLWWIVASVYGIKKHENDKKPTAEQKEDKQKWWHMDFKSIVKALIFWFEEDRKKTFVERIKSIFKWKNK